MSAEPGTLETLTDLEGFGPPSKVDLAHGIPRNHAIGRYVVVDRLGAGGMGVVYLAYDPELDRRVAIKMLQHDLAQEGTDGHARLLAEAQAMARLSHPNVVAVHDVGSVDDGVYIAMEYVTGRTLRDWLASAKPAWPEVLEAFVAAGRGLAAAHAEGLVHRDFKPANAMIDDSGRVRVLDFGLARTTEDGRARDLLAVLGTQPQIMLGSLLTREGAVLGTPAYMAPEQFASLPTDARTDQFSFCVALWEALYGRRPFAANSVVELPAAIMEGRLAPVPPSNVPTRIRDALERGLSHAPTERWRSMDELLAALTPAASTRRWVVVGAGVALVAVAVGVAASPDSDQRCTGAAQELDPTWGADRRSELEAAVLESGVAYAPSAWESVAPRLDEYGAAWTTMHTDVCEATTIRGEQSAAVMDLRMACLQRARRDLAASIDVLAIADEGVLRRAHDVVGALPSIDDCADVEALQSEVPPPSASDLPAVTKVRERLARARALSGGGKHSLAHETALAAQAAGREIDYGPLQTETALWLGFVQYGDGKYEAAERSLLDAQRFAAQWGQRTELLQSTSWLVRVVGGGLADPDAALKIANLALGLAEHGTTDRIRADVYTGIAIAHVTAGRFDEAIAAHREAIELFRRTLGPDHLRVAAAKTRLSNALAKAGQYPEAEASAREVLQLRRRVLGNEHPSVADSLNGLARILEAQGRFDDALQAQQECVEIAVAALGNDHPNTAVARAMYGSALYSVGRFEDAEIETRAAIEASEQSLGVEHAHPARFRVSLASILHAQGKLDAAVAENRLASERMIAVLGNEHPDVIGNRLNLARILQEQGKVDQAVAEFRVGLEAQRAALGPEHPAVGMTHRNLAGALRLMGEVERAEQELRIALELTSAALPDAHPDVAYIRFELGRVLVETGRHEQALPLLEAAWPNIEPLPLEQPERGDAALALAQALQATGNDLARARTLADEQARASYTALGDDEALEAVDAWLRAQ